MSAMTQGFQSLLLSPTFGFLALFSSMAAMGSGSRSSRSLLLLDDPPELDLHPFGSNQRWSRSVKFMCAMSSTLWMGTKGRKEDYSQKSEHNTQLQLQGFANLELKLKRAKAKSDFSVSILSSPSPQVNFRPLQ